MAFELFGFKIERKSQEIKNANIPAFTLPENEDGAMMVSGAGAYGSYMDMEGQFKSEIDLIMKYREMSQVSDCEIAIDNIINEAIVQDGTNPPVDIVLDQTTLSEPIKKKVREEFTKVLDLLNFNNFGHDIFRRWYIEGRIFYHIMIDENNPQLGIVELRSLDSTKVKKVKQVKQEKKDEKQIEVTVQPMYTYNEAGLDARTGQGILISGDSIAYTTSGILNANKRHVLSYLHKSIKPLNQLRMVEDAIVIYRISRAPERRIFYIDVGNLPKVKAEQYIRDIMTRYKNRLVYDSESGEVKDDRRHQSMLEDYWLPRREGGRGTEITTLPGGENLGQLEDVEFFQKKLYKSLHVPVSRLESDSGFSLGRESEITRDELLFSKFIQKLQTRFSHIFDEIMEKQLILKNVMTAAEWGKIKDKVHYRFEKDHYYTEFKQQETMGQRVDLARNMEDWVGQYYSKEWFRKNILRQSDDDIELLDSQMEKEKADGEYEDEGDGDEM
jgi:predicted nucleotidyltransferase